MAEIVKMTDIPVCVAVTAFARLNVGEIKVETNCKDKNGYFAKGIIYTDTEPKKLVYPEG